jgi:hypothetical protein
VSHSLDRTLIAIGDVHGTGDVTPLATPLLRLADMAGWLPR